VASIGAAFTGGYPIGGSFSRSVVAYVAGANTALAGMVTAALLALVVAFCTPLLYHLPLAALAAIIVVACINLIDLAALRRVWRYSRADAASWLITFGAVLELGVQAGVVVGVLTSLLLYLWRSSKPHVTIVGRVGTSEHFRSIHRFAVRTYPNVLAVRVDENLYFANAKYVAELLRAWVADHPRVEHVVLICSGINYIDASAVETLDGLIQELREAGITFHLAEVKSPVLARLERADFLRALAPGRVFLSTHEAMCALAAAPTAPPPAPQQRH
jgi:SulP family sulfate permease